MSNRPKRPPDIHSLLEVEEVHGADHHGDADRTSFPRQVPHPHGDAEDQHRNRGECADRSREDERRAFRYRREHNERDHEKCSVNDGHAPELRFDRLRHPCGEKPHRLKRNGDQESGPNEGERWNTREGGNRPREPVEHAGDNRQCPDDPMGVRHGGPPSLGYQD